MSLAISVGLLAGAVESGGDPEAVVYYRRQFSAVDRVLQANGLPAHREPVSLPDMRSRLGFYSMPYSWLHYARRAVAYALRPGEAFAPLADGRAPSEDPVYDAVMSSFASHVVCHSDCEGFYVPIDFPEPLYDDLGAGDPRCVAGGIIGSSQAALRELAIAAPLLDIPLAGGRLGDAALRAIEAEAEGAHPHGIARKAWLLLSERLTGSIECGAAVVFT